LPPALAAMSVTNPVASFVLGILAFDAPAPRGLGVLSAIAVSGVLITVGIVAWPTRRAHGVCTGPTPTRANLPSRRPEPPIMVAMQLTDAVVLDHRRIGRHTATRRGPLSPQKAHTCWSMAATDRTGDVARESADAP